jgi:hypothetical protein
VLSASLPAQAAEDAAPYVRRSLDDAKSTPAAAVSPRYIRSSLDDPSHAAFPEHAAESSHEGRLIRLSLDSTESYGHLGHEASPARYVRTSLD